MGTHNRPSGFGYQDESTFGSDPGSWAASGVTLWHDPESLDLSELKKEMVEDPRNHDFVFGVHNKIHGLPTATVPFAVPAHGTGTTTTAGNQVSQTEHGKLLEHAMGGEDRTYSTVMGAANLSTTTFDPTVTTGLDDGSWLAAADQDDSSRLFFVRCRGWDGTTFTTDRALPFSPADGDVLHGVQCCHIDETVLRDSRAGSYTRAWMIQKGLLSNRVCARLYGTVAELTEITIGRGAPIMLKFTIHAAKFELDDDVSEVTFANAESGSAPALAGLDSDCWFEDEGTTTNTTVALNELSVTPGIPRVPIPAITGANSNTPGIYGWGFTPADTIVNANIVPHASSYIDKWQADTRRAFRYQTIGSAGNVFGIHCSNCQISETPEMAAAESLLSSRLTLRAHVDDANANAADTQLERSKIHILMA